jgi:hypothetical protein
LRRKVRGCLEYIILYKITPRDQISVNGVIYPFIIKSGEAYSGVPPPLSFAADIFNTFI